MGNLLTRRMIYNSDPDSITIEKERPMADPIKDANINDEPIIVDPDDLPEGDEEQEFDYLDGVEVPDPDNTDEEEEADEADFPDEEEG